MTIILRQIKGAPLTIDEVDNNFAELSKRINQLEQSTPVTECLANIKQQGDELLFIGSLGSQLGQVQIPTLKLTPRGAWQINYSYHINDLVTQDNTVYTCVQNHHSLTFDQDCEHWLKMFEPFKAVSASGTTAEGNAPPLSTSAAVLPVLVSADSTPPVFGSLAICLHNDTIEVLIGDVNCWRRVRDQSEFKFGA